MASGLALEAASSRPREADGCSLTGQLAAELKLSIGGGKASSRHPVRSAYQPPASSTFLSERTSHQQPAATSQQYSSLRTNQHQPSATSQPNRLRAHRVSPSSPRTGGTPRGAARGGAAGAARSRSDRHPSVTQMPPVHQSGRTAAQPADGHVRRRARRGTKYLGERKRCAEKVGVVAEKNAVGAGTMAVRTTWVGACSACYYATCLPRVTTTRLGIHGSTSQKLELFGRQKQGIGDAYPACDPCDPVIQISMPIHVGPGSRIDESTTTRGASLADVPAPIDGVARRRRSRSSPKQLAKRTPRVLDCS
jgi:hypothetical protein